MNLSTKNKLSLSIALAVCLCAPLTTQAANTGGEFKSGNYTGTSNLGYNNVNVDTDDSQLTGSIFGGNEDLSGSAAGNNNKVTVSNITLKNGSVYGGYNVLGSANNNTVIIHSGTIKGNVCGGLAATNGTANNNTVIINGGDISGDIYGGGRAAEANDNTVTINGGTFSASATIYGGNATTSNNNTLQVYTSGISVKSVDKFQNYDLAIDPGKQYTIKVTDDLTLGTDVTITSTRVLSELNVNDTVILLASNGTLTNNATLDNSNKAKQGILYKYGYELVKDDANNLISAKIISKEKNSQSMSVADGQLAAMGMLRSGADLVASSAMDNAAKANTEYDTFAAMNYTKMSMDSVSSVDVQGSSMLVGMGRNIQHTGSNLTIGAFLEAGWGTYESALGLETRAKGHTNYYGVGVLARNNADSGVYTEGSIRVGKVGNTYSGNTEADGTYDVSSTYYGLHLGIGKINKINDTTSTDIYAKYFYAHEGGTSANIAGDNFDFDSIDSHRVRVGGRLNSLNKNINRYVGLAYEYEFSGKAQATAYGVDIATPTAKGSSGILELGLVYKPTTDSKFSMDMGMNGYVGKRKGVTGNVTLNWGF